MPEGNDERVDQGTGRGGVGAKFRRQKTGYAYGTGPERGNGDRRIQIVVPDWVYSEWLEVVEATQVGWDSTGSAAIGLLWMVLVQDSKKSAKEGERVRGVVRKILERPKVFALPGASSVGSVARAILKRRGGRR